MTFPSTTIHYVLSIHFERAHCTVKFESKGMEIRGSDMATIRGRREKEA
jgi:hypothetical protein